MPRVSNSATGCCTDPAPTAANMRQQGIKILALAEGTYTANLPELNTLTGNAPNSVFTNTQLAALVARINSKL